MYKIDKAIFSLFKGSKYQGQFFVESVFTIVMLAIFYSTVIAVIKNDDVVMV